MGGAEVVGGAVEGVLEVGAEAVADYALGEVVEVLGEGAVDGVAEDDEDFGLGDAGGYVAGCGFGPEVADAGFADGGVAGSRVGEEATVVVPLGDDAAEALVLHGAVEILAEGLHLALNLGLHVGREVGGAYFGGEVVWLLEGTHEDGGVLVKIVVEGGGSGFGGSHDEEVRQFWGIRQRGWLPRAAGGGLWRRRCRGSWLRSRRRSRIRCCTRPRG